MRRSRRRAVLAMLASGLSGCLRGGHGTTAPTESGTTASSIAAETPNFTETTTVQLPRELRDAWGPVRTRTVVVHDGVLYRNALDEIVAHDPATGRVQWRSAPEGASSFVTDIAASDSTVFVADIGPKDDSTKDELYALDANDGSVVWHSTVRGLRSRPLVSGDVVLFNTFVEESGAIVALDAESGETRWERDAGPITSNGSTALGSTGPDGDIYVLEGTTRLSGGVLRLDPEDGSIVWRWPGSAPAGPPLVADGSVYVGMYEKFASIDAEDGSNRWLTETYGQTVGMPVVVGDTVYFGSMDTGVYALSTTDGTKQWRYQTGGAVEASLRYVNGVIFASSDDTHLYALDAESGAVLAKRSFSRVLGELAVGGGHVFAVTGSGETVGFDLMALSLGDAG